MKAKWTRRVMCREGKPLAVLRSNDPLRSINAAKRALNTQDYAEVEAIAEAGPMTFVGWLAKDDQATLLDSAGEGCGVLEPGDHIVTFDSPEAMQRAIDRAVADGNEKPHKP